MRRAAVLGIALVAIAAVARGQGSPVGPEFRVNTQTYGTQFYPAAGRDALGNFVVAWSSEPQDGSTHGVFGQRFASSGEPLGPDFRVNTYTTDAQYFPSIAVSASGDFVVLWDSIGQDGSGRGVFGQRFASSGGPLGTEFRVNTYTTNYQSGAAAAADAAGNFVVVWNSGGQDSSAYGVFGQRYASSGAPIGPEFRVNTFTTGFQGGPSVAADPSGNFVVVWASDGQDGSYAGVFGQRFASSGAPLGPEFPVNSYTTGPEYLPAVATDASGSFVVVWQRVNTVTKTSAIFGQRYSSSGSPLGSEFLVNGAQFANKAAIAIDSSGNFVVAWTDCGYPFGCNPAEIIGRRFGSNGTPLAPAFRVNTYTPYPQTEASVASDPAGNFVVVWQSVAQNGNGSGIFGQRFAPMLPVELIHFRIE
jgi:hypothetical protein